MNANRKIRELALDTAKSLQNADLTVSEGFEALNYAKEICRIALRKDAATENGVPVTAK